jgi:sugar lactone lactonase YvrE
MSAREGEQPVIHHSSLPPLPLPISMFDERKCLVGEGPVWDDRMNRVVWVDILGSRILWKSMCSSEVGEIFTPGHIGAVLPNEDLSWLAFLQDKISHVDLEFGHFQELASLPIIADSNTGEPVPMRANDAAVSPEGDVYVGVMPYASDHFQGLGRVYQYSEIGLRIAISGTSISNGIDWSPDGGIMYFIDSALGTVDSLEFSSVPILESRKTLAQIEPSLGMPDGLSVDTDGNLWIGLWNGHGVMALDSAGRALGHIRLPVAHATSCTFVGDDLRHMIVTTSSIDGSSTDVSGATFIVEMPVVGNKQRRIRSGSSTSGDTSQPDAAQGAGHAH